MLKIFTVSVLLSLGQASFGQGIVETLPSTNSLTRTLGVDCQNGYRVEFESIYNGQGSKFSNSPLTTIKVIKLMKDGSGSTTYTVTDNMNFMPDVVSTDPITVHFKDEENTIIDLKIAMDVKSCPSGKYNSSFPASCQGTVTVGSARSNFNENEAIGYVNWEYSSGDVMTKTIKSAGSTSKSLQEVLRQTKNLSNFDNLSSRRCR